MSTVGVLITQTETDATVRHPTLEHHARTKSDGPSEGDVQCTRLRESTPAYFRSASRQGPHAMGNGPLEAEKARTHIGDMDRIEVPRDARILPADRAIHDERARRHVLPRRHLHIGHRGLARSREPAPLPVSSEKGGGLRPHDIIVDSDLGLQIDLLPSRGVAVAFHPRV